MIRSNLGKKVIDNPEIIEARTFLCKQNKDLVFQTPAGKESFLQTGSAKEFVFFDDRFECKNLASDKPLQYFYVDSE